MKAQAESKHSLARKTSRTMMISCVIVGLVALIIGLSIYGTSLGMQYISNAFEMASNASNSVKHGIKGSMELSKQVMEIYRGLTKEQREKMGTAEYREYFSAIDTELDAGGAWDVLVHALKSFIVDVDDVYLALYDEATCALVYIADPDEADRFYPGEWETVPATEVRKFLNWDGEGMLYDISYMEKYGWICTAGYPLRDESGEIYTFVLADVTMNNINAQLKSFALKVTLGVLVLTMIIAWFAGRRMKRMVSTPVNEIANAATAYIQDKKNGREGKENHFSDLNIHTGDELENLSHVMADMERDLARHEDHLKRITAEKERINTELSLASQIQASMMPHVFPPFPGRPEFDLYAAMAPAKEVGGDFYDYFLIDEDHLGLVMADVSGKGVPAALFMMASKIILQSCAMLGQSPGEILTRTNEAICSSNEAQMFITVWVGILQISTGRLTAANAGHEYPVLKEADGSFELLKDRHGFVIGGINGMKYQEYDVRLTPGSKLFLYTDGVPEATNAGKELFGTDRMMAALNRAPKADPETILQNVRNAVDQFVGDAEQFDDLTMLCLAYKGPANH